MSKLENRLEGCPGLSYCGRVGERYIRNGRSSKHRPSHTSLLASHPRETVFPVIDCHLHLISDDHDRRIQAEIRVGVEGDLVPRTI